MMREEAEAVIHTVQGRPDLTEHFVQALIDQGFPRKAAQQMIAEAQRIGREIKQLVGYPA
jgi:hypothetical protein